MRVLKIIRNIILILLALVIITVGVFCYMLSQVPIRAVKHYVTVEVMQEECADYTVFLYPSGKYKYLLRLDDKVRYRIAEYMKENNLVLKTGEQTFCAIGDATFEELTTQDFKFEKRQEH